MWLNRDGITRPSITPDYRKAVVEIYGDLVRYHISLPSSREEALLRIVLRNKREPEANYDDDFPSWILRWDKCLLSWMGLTYSECAQV